MLPLAAILNFDFWLLNIKFSGVFTLANVYNFSLFGVK